MNEFTVDFKENREFNLPIAVNFTIEGAGAATLLASFLMENKTGIAVGLGFVFVGVIILFCDLGNPFRFWRAINQIKTAWISRGACFIACMIALTLLYLVFPVVHTMSIHPLLATCLLFFSFMTILYTGFLIASMPAIPFWNTPYIPALFLFHALASGLSILLCMMVLQGYGLDKIKELLGIEVGLLIVCLFFVFIHISVMNKASVGSRESVKRLLHGKNQKHFFIGGVLIGHLIPLLLCVVVCLKLKEIHTSLLFWLFSLMILRLIGDFYFRLSILKVGIFEPIIDFASE